LKIAIIRQVVSRLRLPYTSDVKFDSKYMQLNNAFISYPCLILYYYPYICVVQFLSFIYCIRISLEVPEKCYECERVLWQKSQGTLQYTVQEFCFRILSTPLLPAIMNTQLTLKKMFWNSFKNWNKIVSWLKVLSKFQSERHDLYWHRQVELGSLV
jgi:hypothetical protein